MARRRWDVDARGIGVADARGWRPIVERLAATVVEDGWVAEEPEAHVLPHVEAAVGDGPLRVRSAQTADDGSFVVDFEWIGEGDPSRVAIRSALFGLVATIAETITVLHEPPADRGRALEILTGSGGGDSPFAGHGHTLRFVVNVPPSSSSGE